MVECKRKENIKCSSFPSHAPIRHTSDPLVSISFPLGSYACASVRELLHPTGIYPFRQEGKQKTTGSRWIQSLVEKGEMSFFSFFSCLVFSLRDQREKRRMGASVQGIRGTVVFFSFPLRLFSGRRLRNPPLGERGGQKGE